MYITHTIMTDDCNNVNSDLNKLNMIQSNSDIVCQDAEVCMPDSSHNYIPGSYRCEKFDITSNDQSNITFTPANVNIQTVVNRNISAAGANQNNQIQIPIVGYEIMEERARFTVYKLRVENKLSGDCWYVFRRYTDFMRLCSRLKHSYPSIASLMPRKKYFGNNFDPGFLEDRLQGLQAFVNAVICIPDLVNSSQIQDFFCLNEPPAYSDTSDESRAIFEALEETIYQLRHQVRDKDSAIENLKSTLNQNQQEIEYLKAFVNNSAKNCQKCCKDLENYQKTFKGEDS